MNTDNNSRQQDGQYFTGNTQTQDSQQVQDFTITDTNNHNLTSGQVQDFTNNKGKKPDFTLDAHVQISKIQEINSKNEDFTNVVKKKENPNKKLSKKENAFLGIYFNNNFNATAAVLKTYKDVTYDSAKNMGWEILTRPHVKAEVLLRQEAIKKSEQIELSLIVKSTKELLERCIRDDDRKNMIKALDMLSKLGGLYQSTPLVSMSTTAGEVHVNFGGWSPDAQAQSPDTQQSSDTQHPPAFE